METIELRKNSMVPFADGSYFICEKYDGMQIYGRLQDLVHIEGREGTWITEQNKFFTLKDLSRKTKSSIRYVWSGELSFPWYGKGNP